METDNNRKAEINRLIERIEKSKKNPNKPYYEVASENYDALMFLTANDIRKENLQSITDFAEICMSLVFVPVEGIINKLKELGLNKSQLKYFIHLNEVIEVIEKISIPKKEQKKFVIDFNVEETLKAIYGHLGIKLMHSILDKFTDSTYTKGNQDNFKNTFSEYILSLKRRKRYSINESVQMFYDEKDKGNTINIIDGLLYSYYNVDENNFAEILIGNTEKHLLSKLIDEKEGVIRIANLNNIKVSKRQIIIRLLPLFILICPHWLLTEKDCEINSEIREKVKESNSSKKYKAFYENWAYGRLNGLLKSYKTK